MRWVNWFTFLCILLRILLYRGITNFLIWILSLMRYIFHLSSVWTFLKIWRFLMFFIISHQLITKKWLMIIENLRFNYSLLFRVAFFERSFCYNNWFFNIFFFFLQLTIVKMICILWIMLVATLLMMRILLMIVIVIMIMTLILVIQRISFDWPLLKY